MNIEKTLLEAADKMPGAMDAGEHKHVALGLLFLRHVSNAFALKHAEFAKEEYADPEDPEEYLAENVFWAPEAGRGSRRSRNRPGSGSRSTTPCAPSRRRTRR